MSNHNYSQYSNNKNYNNDNLAELEVVVEDTVIAAEEEAVANNTESAVGEIELVAETVETVVLPATVTGTVVNCTKLNIRANPSATANVVCILEVNSEMQIDVSKSNNEWFSVCTATGIEGYCMRKFVEASL